MAPTPSPAVDNPRRVIFVGGLQRSGTTLTASMIATHPEVTGLVETPSPENEGEQLQDVFPKNVDMGVAVLTARRARLGLRPSARSAVPRGVTTHWAYHPSASLTERDVPDFPDARRRIIEAWRPYFEKPKASILVEKSPSHVMKTRWLQAVFPESTFLIVTRHPVMQALAVMKWGTRMNRVGLQLPEIVHHWFTAMDRFRDDSSHLEAAVIVRFEDFLGDPEPTLTTLAQHVDIDPRGFVRDVARPRSDQYLPYWRYFAGIDRTAGFSTTIPQRTPVRRLILPIEHLVATALGPSIARRIGRDYESRMREYGYSMNDFVPVVTGRQR